MRISIRILSLIRLRIIRKIIKERISEVVAKVIDGGGGTAALISNHLWREAPLF
jgi:hypothetical protein